MSARLTQRSAHAAPATLRHQLLRSLLAPIIVALLISSVVSYYVSVKFAALAYDNALFNSALDISRQIHFRDGSLHVDLPRAALDMLEADKDDRIYYMVYDTSGKLLAGHGDLPVPAQEPATGKPIYYDSVHRGNPVRIAAMHAVISDAPGEQPVLIQVAETLNKRHTLTNEILLGMLLPQLLLIVAVGLLVSFGVERGLRPLAMLEKEISARSHLDLSPLPEQNAPHEVLALVRAMNELLARLSDALSSQQRFIADAAHQLRTPLAGLKTQTELALRQDSLDEVHGTLRQLNTATGQTTHLVNQLLSLARAEPTALRARQVTVMDLNELARQITAEWVPRALERDIDLGYDAAPGTIEVEGDALLLKEMLRNLLDNAIRYTQRGGQVTVNVAGEADSAVLTVEDNGPGMRESERERAFERFFRGLGTGAEGCGLGLAIVREIAQSHNAQAQLAARPDGKGITASVTFARVRQPAVAKHT